MISALDLCAAVIVLAVSFFFMFRLGFLVGRNLTKKKLLPALSEDLQRATDHLIAEYHGSNCDKETCSYNHHFYDYHMVRTMLVIALITTRGEN